MPRALFIALIVCAAHGAGFAQSGEEILARAERRVAFIDSANLHRSGKFIQRVADTFDVAGRRGASAKTYAIVVRNGLQISRAPVPASDTAAPLVNNAPNSTNVFALRDVILPFNAGVESDSGDRAATAERRSDTVFAGAPCYTVYFQFYISTHYSHEHGGGRMWIAKTDYTPLACAYDFDGYKPGDRRFLADVFVKTAAVGGTVIVAENVSGISFIEQGNAAGVLKTSVHNTDFNMR